MEWGYDIGLVDRAARVAMYIKDCLKVKTVMEISCTAYRNGLHCFVYMVIASIVMLLVLNNKHASLFIPVVG